MKLKLVSQTVVRALISFIPLCQLSTDFCYIETMNQDRFGIKTVTIFLMMIIIPYKFSQMTHIW